MRIILICCLEESVVIFWVVSAGSVYGPVVGFCEHANEHANSVRIRIADPWTG